MAHINIIQLLKQISLLLLVNTHIEKKSKKEKMKIEIKFNYLSNLRKKMYEDSNKWLNYLIDKTCPIVFSLENF